MNAGYKSNQRLFVLKKQIKFKNQPTQQEVKNVIFADIEC